MDLLSTLNSYNRGKTAVTGNFPVTKDSYSCLASNKVLTDNCINNEFIQEGTSSNNPVIVVSDWSLYSTSVAESFLGTWGFATTYVYSDKPSLIDTTLYSNMTTT